MKNVNRRKTQAATSHARVPTAGLAMPREYDPRRYGQLSTESNFSTLPNYGSAPAPSPSEVLRLMMSPTSRLLKGRDHGEGRGGGHLSLVPTQTIPYDQLSHVRLALPEDVLTALAGIGCDGTVPASDQM